MGKLKKIPDRKFEELALSGMKYSEIATMLNCSTNTVYVRLKRVGFRKRNPYNKAISKKLQEQIIEMRSRPKPISYMKIKNETGVSCNASRSIWLKYLESQGPMVSDHPLRALMRSVDMQASKVIKNWSVTA